MATFLHDLVVFSFILSSIVICQPFWFNLDSCWPAKKNNVFLLSFFYLWKPVFDPERRPCCSRGKWIPYHFLWLPNPYTMKRKNLPAENGFTKRKYWHFNADICLREYSSSVVFFYYYLFVFGICTKFVIFFFLTGEILFFDLQM